MPHRLLCADRHDLAGRWFAGMGVGGLSAVVPMLNAELAPASIRGTLVGLQQVAICCKYRVRMNTSHSLLLTPAPVGIMISYWIGYGTNFIGGTTYPEQSSAAWRIPLAIQLVPAIILCVGSWFLPFSPRWLMLVGREEESLAVLAKVRRARKLLRALWVGRQDLAQRTPRVPADLDDQEAFASCWSRGGGADFWPVVR
jgi:MFS family permease